MAAEAAISSVVELLGDLLIQKVKSLRGVEGKVDLLREELKRMQSFLKDANKKQFEDESVRNWISEIRELAQDAQDTIELFLLNVESAKNWGLLERCTSFPKRMHHLDKIGDEIESIRARLDAIDKSRERYGIKDLVEAAESASRSQVESRRRLCPWQKDEHLVGVEDDVKKLLQESILCAEKKGLSIAVLEGMGGIGKSTLAREIYNHPDVVAGPFDRRGWVVVSSEFTPHETIKQLLLQLQKSEEDKRKRLDEIKKLEESIKDKLIVQEELKQMLYKQLESKSYFIVLDDVWEKQHLESLITAFPNQQGKFACGRLHWVAVNGGHTYIESFDLKREVFETMELPCKLPKGDGICPWLWVIEGCLSVVCDDYGKGKRRVWIMKEYGVKESWVEEISKPSKKIRRCCEAFFYPESLVSPIPQENLHWLGFTSL